MMKTLFLVLIIVIAVIATLIIFYEGPVEAGIRNDEIIVDGISRRYRIVIPHRATQPMPIVFAFHGIGDSEESMAEYSRLDRTAARHGFMLVYPVAHRSMWSTVSISENELEANPDIRFYDRLLAHIDSNYTIDRDRVYLMGMSNGASFAQLLATERSEEIAAVVAHSGPRLKGTGACRNPIPFLLIVGGKDAESSTMRSDADQYRAQGHPVQFIEVPGLAHQWSVTHNDVMWRFAKQSVLRSDIQSMPSKGMHDKSLDHLK